MQANADTLIATRFDTVIYDLDGTLIESAKDMQVAVSRVLADHGLPAATEEDMRAFMGQGSKVTMASVGLMVNRMTAVITIISTSVAKSSRCSDRNTLMRSVSLPMRAI